MAYGKISSFGVVIPQKLSYAAKYGQIHPTFAPEKLAVGKLKGFSCPRFKPPTDGVPHDKFIFAG
jgi:hypothetical protein